MRETRSFRHKKAGPGPAFSIGRGDRIRTCDLYVPNVALYQTELHPDTEPQSLMGRDGYDKGL